MVDVVAYFTAEDELTVSRLRRHLRDGGWRIEWAEEGCEGWMVRAVRSTAFETRHLAQTAAKTLAVSSGAVCECAEIELFQEALTPTPADGRAR